MGLTPSFVTFLWATLVLSTCVGAFAPARAGRSTRNPLSMSIIDDLKLIFSDEGKKNRAAYYDGQRSEQEAAQKELLERRRNPEKMREYEEQTAARRKKLADEREVWKFQQKKEGDPLDDWKTLRAQGKIKVGSDLERDPSSSRLGSEGLVDVRVDERMPYIDQGYVDEDADVMGNFMKMFGGGKKIKSEE